MRIKLEFEYFIFLPNLFITGPTPSQSPPHDYGRRRRDPRLSAEVYISVNPRFAL